MSKRLSFLNISSNFNIWNIFFAKSSSEKVIICIWLNLDLSNRKKRKLKPRMECTPLHRMNFKTETVSAVPKSVLNLKIYPVIELMAYLVNFFFLAGRGYWWSMVARNPKPIWPKDASSSFFSLKVGKSNSRAITSRQLHKLGCQKIERKVWQRSIENFALFVNAETCPCVD